LPRILADHGYVCGLSGKLHLGSCSDGKVEERINDGYSVFHWSHHPQPDWAENAYTQWLASKGKTWEELYSGPEVKYVKEGVPAEFHQTTWCAEMAIDFIREQSSVGKPWLFSVNMFAPHHPFDPPAEYLQRYNPDDMPVPKEKAGELDNKPEYQQLDHKFAHNSPDSMEIGSLSVADCQRITAAYYAMCEHIDHEVGRMVDALAESGQLENTIVIFMSDHGEMLGDHGLFLKGPHFYDEAIRVPLVLSLPGEIQENLRSDALVELTDLVPTLMELCGLEPESQIQGRSFRGLLTGEADPSQHREAVFSEYCNAWSHRHAYGTMLRTRDHKIVSYAAHEPGELYDLTSDPDEFENLWDSTGHQTLQLDMLKKCFDASVFTMDPHPLRRGAF